MAAEVIDPQHLSSYCALPKETITTLLDAPTADLVRSLLLAVTHKAREHEEIRSENLRLSVELENAVRTGESKARVLKSSVDKGLKEVDGLRQKLQSEGMFVPVSFRALELTVARANNHNIER